MDMTSVDFDEVIYRLSILELALFIVSIVTRTTLGFFLVTLLIFLFSIRIMYQAIYYYAFILLYVIAILFHL